MQEEREADGQRGDDGDDQIVVHSGFSQHPPSEKKTGTAPNGSEARSNEEGYKHPALGERAIRW